MIIVNETSIPALSDNNGMAVKMNSLVNCFRKMNEMWDQMSAELRTENQDIFIAYHDRVARKEFDSDEMDPQFGGGAERKIGALAPSLRHCFDDAMMSKAPSDVYVAVPSTVTRLRIALLAFAPTGWREYFIQRKYKHNIANILKVWTAPVHRCQLGKVYKQLHRLSLHRCTLIYARYQLSSPIVLFIFFRCSSDVLPMF